MPEEPKGSPRSTAVYVNAALLIEIFFVKSIKLERFLSAICLFSWELRI